MALAYYEPHKTVDARNPASKPVLINGAKEGHVLVKNTNNALPLNKPKMISIFGYDAVAPPANDVASASQYFGQWTLGAESIYSWAPFLSPGPPPQIAINGTIISGAGSGANSPAYISSPFDALNEQAYADGTAVFWDFKSQNPAVDTSTDACFVFINAFSTEGNDRPGLHGKHLHESACAKIY